MSQEILGPGHTYATVTDKISSIVLTRKWSPGWLVLMRCPLGRPARGTLWRSLRRLVVLPLFLFRLALFAKPLRILPALLRIDGVGHRRATAMVVAVAFVARPAVGLVLWPTWGRRVGAGRAARIGPQALLLLVALLRLDGFAGRCGGDARRSSLGRSVRAESFEGGVG